MGPGGSQKDAAFPLRASVPAGNYHVVCDAIITGPAPIDVTFSLIWRHGFGAPDTSLVEWSRRFDPLPGGGFDAQAYEVDMAAPAIDFKRGDQLVFRYAGNGPSTALAESFIPNGDGPNADGRIPNITLPP